MKRWIATIALVCAGAVVCSDATIAHAQSSFLRDVGSSLAYESADGFFSTHLSGIASLEQHYFDGNPPGLIFGGGHTFTNPRLSLFLDSTLGASLSSFVQARFDRGFDPRSEDFTARLDEYTLRYQALTDPALALQVGKFATVIGNFGPRHDDWENPFVNAPLPYENVLTITDRMVPRDAAELLSRKHTPDKKAAWVPIIWGPAYTSGAATFFNLGTFDLAFELKNASPSSRPSAWNLDDHGFRHPTIAGRIGARPDPAWNAGLSASFGSYLRADADDSLPAGTDRSDFTQQLLGADLKYEHGYLTLLGELFVNRFEVPNVDDCDTLAYYVEGKYKLLSDLFAAVRWNQQFFNDISDGQGGKEAWDNDFTRIDLSLGYELIENLLGKLQYSYSHQLGPIQQSEHYVAVQVDAKF